MNGRERVSLDLGWKFSLAQGELLQPYETWLKAGDFRFGVPSRGFDDASWRSVDTPHDFVVEGQFIAESNFTGKEPHTHHTVHGSKPGGVGWYRRHFSVDSGELGRRFYLFFDGVFRDSRIYLNEYFVGRQPSGYTSFWFDVTDIVEYGGDNLLVVRADASRPEGWFYEGGGIYRHVWLVKAAPVHVAPWGTFVWSDLEGDPSRPSARVHIVTTIANRQRTPADVALRSVLLDPSGGTAGETVTRLTVKPGCDRECPQELALKTPRLWSVDDPALHTLVTTVEVDGRAADEYRTVTGIRTARFDAEKGFLLNGRPVTLKGVCCHQDHAGVGSALPDALQEFRLRRLKELGCNAYRCSHNPPTPELLDAADRLGILVMDENRLLSTAPQQAQELEAMVRRDRNHPSVVLWSLGNEEFFSQWLPQSARIARTLCDSVHRWDPSRQVTLAVCFWNPAIQKPEPLERLPMPCGELDAMGFNYMGEYWDGYRERHPGQPTVVSEASTPSQTRGCYETDNSRSRLGWKDSRSNWSDAEDHWRRVATQPHLSGIFLWTGFDYRGEPGPYGWPAISSQFGILDTCGFPKDSAFYYKAMWRPEPLVHIFPHWNWPAKMGQPILVGCYSNCEEVELFLNERSLGRKVMPAYGHLEWPDVAYEPGVLEARGFRDGKPAAHGRVETTGAPHAVRLSADRPALRAGCRDVCVVDASIVDEEGRVVPVAENEVVFHVDGPGRIVGVGNGDPSSHESDQASHRRAFHGWCQAILQAGDTGEIVLTASAAGLVASKVTLKVGDGY